MLNPSPPRRKRAHLFALTLALVSSTACQNTVLVRDDTGGAGGSGPSGTSSAGPTSTSSGVPNCFEGAGLDGDWLLAVSTALNPVEPFVYRATITTTATVEGAQIGLSAVPLSAMDQTTPVGPPEYWGMFPITPTAFNANLGSIDIPPEANPITGAPVTATMSLSGQFCGTDPNFACGSVSGEVTSPITFMLDPAKTTFTMQRILGAVPAPVIDCAKHPANYD